MDRDYSTGRLDRVLAGALLAHPPTARYLVGVSGGVDSTALLHVLHAAGYRRLIVCHLDHALRGRQSTADARFVERLATSLDLDFETARIDVAAQAKETGRSLETAAREARYSFFADVARRRRCRTLFLAHHADDQAETFLFNLLRGAGSAGLGAMRADATHTVGRCELRVIRPLLGVWRSEIVDYAKAHKLKWREDASNREPVISTRNRLRLEILPLLSQAMGRDVRSALWRAAELLAADDDCLTEQMATLGPPPAEWSVRTVGAMPLAHQRRWIRAWLKSQGVGGIGFEEVESVRGLLDSTAGGPAKINLPGGRHARRRAGRVFLE